MEYGDEDVLGTVVYPGDPKTGATLEGLLPDAVTLARAAVVSRIPILCRRRRDHPGTDEIYVGSVQTAGPRWILWFTADVGPAGASSRLFVARSGWAKPSTR